MPTIKLIPITAEQAKGTSILAPQSKGKPAITGNGGGYTYRCPSEACPGIFAKDVAKDQIRSMTFKCPDCGGFSAIP